MKKVLFALAALMLTVSLNAQTVFSEDFNGSTDIPTGWITYADDLPNYSSYTAYGQSWTVLNFSSDYGNSALSISWTDPAGPCDRWLVTPQININQAGLALCFLSWGYTSGQYAEEWKVMISTTDNQKSSFSVLQDLGSIDAGWAEQMIDLSAYNGQNVYIAFVNYGDGYYTALDNVTVKVPAQNEIKLASVSVPSYAGVNTNVNVSGTVINKGMQPLTSFDVTYSANGQSTGTYTVSGINVPYNGTYSFTHDVAYTTDAEGSVTFLVDVSNPNGVSDDASDNHGTGHTTFYDASSAVARTIMLEHFTTGQCPNCPPAHERVAAAIEGFNVVWACHHDGYYTDVMTIPAHTSYCWFYNAGGSTYAPAIMLDRTFFQGEPWAETDAETPVFFPGSDVRNAFQVASEVPAFMNIAISGVNFNDETRELTCTVAGNFTADLNVDNPRLNLWLIEDSIQANQSGATPSNTYRHMHVMRQNITDTWGDATAITSVTAGTNFSKTYTYTVPSNIKVFRCRLAAFVSNYDSSNPNNCNVLNATQTPNIDAPRVGIAEVENNVELNLYPNPVSDFAVIEANSTIREVRVVNALGQQIYTNTNVNNSQLRINTESFAAGLYIVTIKTNEGVATKRVSVVK